MRLSPSRDDFAIVIVHFSAIVLSTRISDFGREGCGVSSSLMESRKVFHENVTVVHSRLLEVTRSGDKFFM